MEFLQLFNDIADEEDQQIVEQLVARRKARVVRPRPSHIDNWDDEEFRRRFRLKKTTVLYLLELIEEKIKHKTNRNQCASPLEQLLVTLRFYACGNFYITVGDFSGLAISTVCKIVHRTTDAIASLRAAYVTLPRTQEEIQATQISFYDIARFPRVVSAIDCTHIRIISPGGEIAEIYRNRKGYFSLNVQAMCNANLYIQDVVARWPGSTHDALIFANSAAKYKFDSGQFNDGKLLGDSGYFNNEYLLTPLNEVRSEEERLYNESQIRSRNVIERCFGVWKRRFPVLSVGMRCRVPLVQDVIIATSVLHNLALTQNDEEPPADQNLHIEQMVDVPAEPQVDVQVEHPDVVGRDVARIEAIAYFRTLL